MKSIGYTPDCGNCNYLIVTLSKIDQFGEVVEVLKVMGGAGCDSYGGLIVELSEARKVDAVVEVVREMVCKEGGEAEGGDGGEGGGGDDEGLGGGQGGGDGGDVGGGGIWGV
ncbi:hypothetical protein SASPL_120999 [Salvia splendens]|uniref:Uncharacterized protein n=1 Tax=Salvia splendens TaxID=180675 RepID=A0A8X8XU32_SALSN|nr:pentatricopeptide repeat-containing protein At1g06270-like [Salvia splendens]KAG6418794.1 hypothetical protein SASPL_120999 [Salvia splendens]